MDYTGKISIVIPCYNHGAVLREALASVEEVRNENLGEVIIVNDGSTDVETCRLFEELDKSKYKIVHQSNRGLGAARNAGVKIAQGEFILTLDSDNRIRQCYLTLGVKTLMENPKLGVVYGDAELFGEETGRSRVPDFDFFQLAAGNYIDACALFRKCAWESVGGYDEDMPWMGYEDWDFWRRVALQGWQFRHLDEVAYDYRVASDSMLRRVTNPHEQELRAYMNGKREGDVLRAIGEVGNKIQKLKANLKFQQIEIEQLTGRLKMIESSPGYKLGELLMYIPRKIKKIFT